MADVSAERESIMQEAERLTDTTTSQWSQLPTVDSNEVDVVLAEYAKLEQRLNVNREHQAKILVDIEV